MPDYLFFARKTLFRKVFFITVLTSLLPLLVLWFYLVQAEVQIIPGLTPHLTRLFSGFFALAFMLSLGGAYLLSKRFTRPIRHFIRSATEIARGNFNERVAIESSDEIGKLAKIFNYMATELRRLNDMNLNKIINEKNKTDAIIKNIGDGVIVTDEQNRILMMNAAMEAWFGIRERDALNEPLESSISNTPLLKFIRATQSGDKLEPPSIEIVIKSPRNWKDIFLQAGAARVTNDRGDLIGIVTILRDVTREKEIDRMKTELVSLVAHELRSPLTSISGFSELLLDPLIDRDQSEEYATIILKEASRLSDLINKFLDISKIEAGKSQIKKAPMQLRDVVDKVLDVNLQQAEKKGIIVAVKVAPNLPQVLGDRDMLEQVVLNLFSNAVKYSPENSAIEIRLKARDNDVVAEVEDHGYGISEKSLPKIFDKFYRVTDNEHVREISGTGLGLSLVKEVVEIHEGTLSVRSKLSEGSTFSFTIPIYSGSYQERNFDETELGMISTSY